MKLTRFIRRKLGPIKRVLLDEMPFKGHVKRIPEVRGKYRLQIENLAPVPAFRENLYEIHMLCGQRDLDMGIWASWSMMRFLEGNSRLYVHSDGTLTPEDVIPWRKIVGELVLVDREESDQKVKAGLGSVTKHLFPWRSIHWASAQLVDVHFFGNAPTLLIMDSDVLTFSRPHEVMGALRSPTPEFAWSRDLLNAYSADLSVMKEATGVTLPDRLCAGFLVSPRLTTKDFQELDRHMESIDRDGRVELNHFWSCQTYYALLASGRGGTFPDTYSNTVGITKPQQVVRHYVGVPRVRFRYFTEGLQRVMRAGQQSSEKQ